MVLRISWEILSAMEDVSASVTNVILQTDMLSSGATDTGRVGKEDMNLETLFEFTLSINCLNEKAAIDDEYDDLRSVHHEENTQNKP